MLNSLRNILITVSIALLFSSAWSAESKSGGQGFMESEFLLNTSEGKCFDIKNSPVAAVCAKYRINWKLWSLMGEPVGDYNLEWQLYKIILKGATGNPIAYYGVEQLPKPLQAAANATELYIEGVADISGGLSGSFGYHAFNTGVPVRAGVGTSMNVPGSPSWGTLFLNRPECNDKEYPYMNAQDAKLAFKKGIKLQLLNICPKSSMSVSSLVSAIKELCKSPGADKTHRFCPKQIIKKEKMAETNAIDDAFTKLEKKAAETPIVKAGSIDDAFTQMEASQIEKERLRVAAIKEKKEREDKEVKDKIRREEAIQFCTVAMRSEQSCLQDACKKEPSKTICTDLRQDPIEYNRDTSPMREGESRFVFPKSATYTCYSDGVNPAYSVWQSCAKNMASQCSRDGKQPTSLDECIVQREKSTDQGGK